MGEWRVPLWVMVVLSVATAFNVFIFVSIAGHMWSPSSIDMNIEPSVALGFHLQLFEAFIAAVGVSLAVFGFVGFSAIRNAAISAAIKAVQDQQSLGNAGQHQMTAQIGTVDRQATLTREKEEEQL